MFCVDVTDESQRDQRGGELACVMKYTRNAKPTPHSLPNQVMEEEESSVSASGSSALEDFTNDVQPTKAVKISRGAFSAAICYSRLVSVRGSIAVGIVDIAALSCMAALLKRWCGDMQISAVDKTVKKTKKRPAPPKKKKTSKRTKRKVRI